MSKWCAVPVKIESMDASTFYCLQPKGHTGPHVIDVIGSDALAERLEEGAGAVTEARR